MASLIRNIEFIKIHFDEHFEFVLKKINESTISLTGKSTNYVNSIVYPIVNYIDFINNNKLDGLENLSLETITKLYNIWFEKTTLEFTTKDYVETNNIIIDYRKNGIGYYWVDLNNHYNSDMLFRMHNCGRVNSYQTLLKLREFDANGYNHSRVVIVLHNNGCVNQVRGDSNIKPNKLYNNFIYDLFLNYNSIGGFKFLSTYGNDFTHMDLTPNQLLELRNTRPELFSSTYLI